MPPLQKRPVAAEAGNNQPSKVSWAVRVLGHNGIVSFRLPKEPEMSNNNSNQMELPQQTLVITTF